MKQENINNLKLFCKTNNTFFLQNLTQDTLVHINEIITKIINKNLKTTDRYFNMYMHMVYMNFYYEVLLRHILWNAKYSFYNNPQKIRKIDYEANNVFNRFIISYFTFINKSFIVSSILINRDNGKEKELLQKVQSEMKEKKIEYDIQQLIDNINKPLLDNMNITSETMSVINLQTIIKNHMTQSTYERMVKKYLKYNDVKGVDKKEYINLRIALVFYRYNTYNAFSQCWTATKKDMPNYKNPDLKTIELFGSPFNTQVDTYIFGTLFPDTDHYFGGLMNYYDLAKYILDCNKKGEFFNIQISPPNVENILETLVPIVLQLKEKNNILVMYPHWTDNKSYKGMEEIFPNKKIITDYLDMWNDKVVSVSKSTLFF